MNIFDTYYNKILWPGFENKAKQDFSIANMLIYKLSSANNLFLLGVNMTVQAHLCEELVNCLMLGLYFMAGCYCTSAYLYQKKKKKHL